MRMIAVVWYYTARRKSRPGKKARQRINMNGSFSYRNTHYGLSEFAFEFCFPTHFLTQTKNQIAGTARGYLSPRLQPVFMC